MLRRASSSALALFLTCVPSSAQTQEPSQLALRYASFDPLAGEPAVPSGFAAAREQRLCIVQFAAIPCAADRDALHALGAEVAWYLPHDAFVVRATAEQRTAIAKSPTVRWVGAFHPAYKLEGRLLASLLAGTNQAGRHLVVMVDPSRDETALLAAVERLGGSVWRHARGNLLIEADLSAAQVSALAHDDTVAWIESATPIGVDMDNARIQGGANQIETLAGHTGKGVRGHVLEGIFPAHPEYAANTYRTAPIAVFSGAATTHGNSTFGEVFSSGVNPQARGLCPDGQGYFTDFAFLTGPTSGTTPNTRYGIVQEITNPALQWRVMFQTASWGSTMTTQYTAVSAEMDWIIHTFDIPICQSTSNLGTQSARPQAWAKNVISVSSIFHNDTANPNDDVTPGAALGPAEDGRIKPDLCGYGDSIFTTDGAATYTPSFGGASGATPMVAGHLGLVIEMFTDGYFGHAATPSWQNRFDYKPHFSTSKALLLNSARQYDPAIVGNGTASRFRQGWGFPAMQDLYSLRRNMLVLDEIDVLPQGGARTYWVQVKPGTPQLRTTMVYADLPGNPAAVLHRVNDLDVKVTSPAGTIYHGNTGMSAATGHLFTAPGGTPNPRDTVENVYVQNPATGLWRIDVSAPLVALDQHVETAAVDADFALVASGIGGGRDPSGPQLDLASTGPGNLSVTLTNLPSSYVDGHVMFSLSTARPLAMGNFLGLEADGLSVLSLTTPASPGDPLHFPSTANPGTFPNGPFVFPAFVPAILQGITLDAVAIFFDATGTMHAASNVDRVVVQ